MEKILLLVILCGCLAAGNKLRNAR